MTRSETQLFGVNTVDDYLALCSEAVGEFTAQQDSVLKGFTAILVLNHLPDWLRYKLTAAERNTLGLSSQPEAEVVSALEARNADLTLVRQIANGFKHLRPVHPTQKVEGYGNGPFGVGPFGVPYLLIDLGEDEDTSKRWCLGLNLCERVLAWWQAELAAIVTMEDS